VPIILYYYTNLDHECSLYLNLDVPGSNTNGPFSIIAPVNDEQPGPPFNHNINGAFLLSLG
jgi:hypothetical protein